MSPTPIPPPVVIPQKFQASDGTQFSTAALATEHEVVQAVVKDLQVSTPEAGRIVRPDYWLPLVVRAILAAGYTITAPAPVPESSSSSAA